MLAAGPIQRWNPSFNRRPVISIAKIVAGDQPAHRMRYDVKFNRFINAKPFLSLRFHIGFSLEQKFMKPLGIFCVVSAPIIGELKTREVAISVVDRA